MARLRPFYSLSSQGLLEIPKGGSIYFERIGLPTLEEIRYQWGEIDQILGRLKQMETFSDQTEAIKEAKKELFLTSILWSLRDSSHATRRSCEQLAASIVYKYPTIRKSTHLINTPITKSVIEINPYGYGIERVSMDHGVRTEIEEVKIRTLHLFTLDQLHIQVLQINPLQPESDQSWDRS